MKQRVKQIIQMIMKRRELQGTEKMLNERSTKKFSRTSCVSAPRRKKELWRSGETAQRILDFGNEWQ